MCLVCGVEGQRLGNTCLKNVPYKNGQENTRGKGKDSRVEENRAVGLKKRVEAQNETERKDKNVWEGQEE